MTEVKPLMKSRRSTLSAILDAGATSVTILLFMLPLRWEANEYMYFSQAQFSGVAPGSYASAADNPSNWLFILVVRELIDWFGLDEAWLLVRISGVILLGISLSTFARSLNLPVLSASLALSLFIATGQTYMAGEWIIEGSESKVFGYAFLMFGSAMVLQNRLNLFGLFASLATVTHPHLGILSWVFGGLISLTCSSRKAMTIKKIALWAAPSFLYLVALSIYTDSGSSSDEKAESRLVYTFVRHPHHLVPFGEDGFFNPSQLVLPSIVIGFLFTISRQRTLDKENSSKIALLLVMLHAVIPLTLLVSWLDSSAELGRLYVFRFQSPLLLISLIVIVGSLLQALDRSSSRALLLALALFLSVGVPKTSWIEIGNITEELTATGQALAREVSEVTPPEAQIFVEFSKLRHETGLRDQNFELLVNRGVGATWKFIPTRPQDILRWLVLVDPYTREGAVSCDELARLGYSHVLTTRDSDSFDHSCGQIRQLAAGAILISVGPQN